MTSSSRRNVTCSRHGTFFVYVKYCSLGVKQQSINQSQSLKQQSINQSQSLKQQSITHNLLNNNQSLKIS